MYHAWNIADRYLAHLARRKERAPDLLVLEAAALFVGAKIGEPLEPSCQDIISLFPEYHKFRVTRHALLNLEVTVIRALNFEFKLACPLEFLERYQRLLSLDRPEEQPGSKQIGTAAR